VPTAFDSKWVNMCVSSYCCDELVDSTVIGWMRLGERLKRERERERESTQRSVNRIGVYHTDRMFGRENQWPRNNFVRSRCFSSVLARLFHTLSCSATQTIHWSKLSPLASAYTHRVRKHAHTRRKLCMHAYIQIHVL
jgi:hypothetical protein